MSATHKGRFENAILDVETWWVQCQACDYATDHRLDGDQTRAAFAEHVAEAGERR